MAGRSFYTVKWGLGRCLMCLPWSSGSCNTVQQSATQCNTLQHTATYCSTYCSTLQQTLSCSTLQQTLDISNIYLDHPTWTQNMSPFVALCCSVLKCVAVCCRSTSIIRLKSKTWAHQHAKACSLSQWVCCNILQCVAVGWSGLKWVAVVAVCCSVMYCVAVCCSSLHCVALCCIVLHCVAVCCGAL